MEILAVLTCVKGVHALQQAAAHSLPVHLRTGLLRACFKWYLLSLTPYHLGLIPFGKNRELVKLPCMLVTALEMSLLLLP